MNSQTEADTKVDHDELDGCFKLQLNDNPNLKKKITHSLVKLLKCWPRNITQSTPDYSWLILSMFAIFSFVVILSYFASSGLHSESAWTRYAMIVSLCNLSPSLTIQRDTYKQAGSTLKGKFFYTVMDADPVDSDEVCGVEITLIANPSTTGCKMIFTQNTANIPKRTIAGMNDYFINDEYDWVMLPEVNEKSYNRSFHIYDKWLKVTLKSSYNQFSTEWLKRMQFGDTTYDSLLLTMQTGAETLVVDLNHALIMRTKQQGHESQAVQVLSFVGKSMIIDKSVGKVLSQAMLNFCGKVLTSSNNASLTLELACDGLTDLPPGLQCYTDESDAYCTCDYT